MINIIFNILTLIVVTLLGVYIFKRYFLKTLKNLLNKEASQKEELINEQDELIIAQRDIDQSIKAQEKECANLRVKIDQWKSMVGKNKEEKLAIYKKNLEEFKKKLELESYNYSQKKLRQELTYSVVESLEGDLEDYFEKEKNARKFFGYIMSNMNRCKLQD